MHPTEITGLDTLAAILGTITVTVSLLTLLGMAIMMAVGAMFQNRPLVTSWSETEQHAFATYEQRGVASSSRAWGISLGCAAIAMVAAVGVYFGVTPEMKNMGKDMNMSNLTKKHAPAAPKPDAPAAPAAAPAPAADPAAPAAAPAAEAPKP
ncbi:MAG TPA: hypothetical protein VGC42_16140 [Kofleriaceae bacterium]